MQELISKHRLGGDAVPNDLALLLAHQRELKELIGLNFHDEPDWAPWADTSYLSAEELSDPELQQSIKASLDVCEQINFVADICRDYDFLGYWRTPSRLPIVDSPIVWLNSENTFSLFDEKNFAMAVLYHFDFAEAELLKLYEKAGIEIDRSSRETVALTPEQYLNQRLEFHA